VAGAREHRIGRWQSRAQVYLVGYEVLRNDRTLPGPFGPAQRVWDLVVADEAQRIKNEDTEVSSVLKGLQRRRTWALTGTPVENCAEDAASILDFVAPGQLDRREMMVGLRRTLGDVQLRRRRTEVLPELPPKTSVPIDITLGPVRGPARRVGRGRAPRPGLAVLAGVGHHHRACAGADSPAQADLQRLPADWRVGEAGRFAAAVSRAGCSRRKGAGV
jgi:hypothetical protein